MVFIESSFTLSLSVHVISCSCTYTNAAFSSVKKDTWGQVSFYTPLPALTVKVMHVCAWRVIRSSWLSPSISSGFTSTVRNVSLLSDDQTSGQATKSWQIFSVESRFKIKLMIRLMEMMPIERLMNIWLLLVVRKQLNSDWEGWSHIHVLCLFGCQTEVDSDAAHIHVCPYSP